MRGARAGFYPDPLRPADKRWWDGLRWTHHTLPPAGPGLPHPSQPIRVDLRPHLRGWVLRGLLLLVLLVTPWLALESMLDAAGVERHRRVDPPPPNPAPAVLPRGEQPPAESNPATPLPR